MTGETRQFQVDLPLGLVDAGGRRHTRAILRKMRGHEEALLYDPALSAGRLVTELLAGCVLRLGEVDAPGAEVLSDMYSADRNYLLLELRRVTLGDRLHCSYSCASCAAEIAVIEDLSALEVRRLPEDAALQAIVVELEDGYVDREGVLHTRVTLRLPRGHDEELVAGTAERDPLRARDALLLRCLESFGTLPRAALEAYGLKILRDLSLGDRRRIARALDEGAFGVDFRRSIRCGQCGARFDAALSVSRFFEAG